MNTLPDTPLAGARRAAILMLSLGEEVSIRLMRHLSGEELRSISDATHNMADLSPEEIEKVLDDFARSMTGPFVGPGGGAYLRSLAIRALGHERADLLLGPPPAPPKDPDPITDCVDLSPQAVATLLEREHPQIAALVLASLSPDRAAKVVALLESGIQVDVVTRMARLEQLNPELVRDIGEALLGEVRSIVTQGSARIDGPSTAASILKMVGRNEEVLEALMESAPELAVAIRKQLFTFSDVADLDPRGVQQILREVDSGTLTLALKSATDTVSDKILANMSSRAADMIREDLEAMGPVRLADVEKAHEEIVGVALRLADEGTITIQSGEDLV